LMPLGSSGSSLAHCWLVRSPRPMPEACHESPRLLKQTLGRRAGEQAAARQTESDRGEVWAPRCHRPGGYEANKDNVAQLYACRPLAQTGRHLTADWGPVPGLSLTVAASGRDLRDRARRGGQVGPNPVCLHPARGCLYPAQGGEEVGALNPRAKRTTTRTVVVRSSSARNLRTALRDGVVSVPRRCLSASVSLCCSRGGRIRSDHVITADLTGPFGCGPERPGSRRSPSAAGRWWWRPVAPGRR
jgi:hypothetical protein